MVSGRWRELVWLRCDAFQGKNLPVWPLESLRILELHRATKLQRLWKAATDAPLQLRELLLTWCPNFKEFPRSIGLLKHLKILRCGGSTMMSLPEEFCSLQSLQYLQLLSCTNLSSLPRHFGNLTNLRHLDLSGCSNLSSLPSRFGDLTNLQLLHMDWCIQLRTLPVSFKQLTLLQYLNFNWCSELTIESQNLDILENMTRLQYLNFSGCTSMEDLPRHIDNGVSLKELYLTGTRIREVPANIGQLRKLEILTVGSDSLTSLPTSLGNLCSLLELKIIRCKKLECLPGSLGNLCSLLKLEVSFCNKLECLPDSLGNLCSLLKLEVRECYNLECLPGSLGNLCSLLKLEVSWCGNLEYLPDSFGNLYSLRVLEVRWCGNLEYLPDSVGCLNKLEDLTISLSGVKTLPESFTRLVNLQSLDIHYSPISELSFGPGCKLKRIFVHETKLSKISISEDCCPCLRTLQLRNNDCLMEVEILPTAMEVLELVDCKMLKDIRGICGLVNLQKLKIINCADLHAVPYLAELTSLREIEVEDCLKVQKIEGLEYLRSLEKLMISDCRELSSLSNLAKLTFLKEFKLTGCQKVQKLKGLEYLRSLEKLTICSCRELDGLPSFAELTSLKTFELKGCHKVEKIEGLEELRSLEEFKAYTCWKLPCIIRLEKARKLRKLEVVADEKSVVEHCIPTIHQKWPAEVIICTRAVCDVGSFVNSPAFPNLRVLNSLHYRSLFTANAVMICIIINGASAEMDLGEGKWVWMAVFTGNSVWHTEDFYYKIDKKTRYNVVESAWSMTGEDEEIQQSFRRLFHTCAAG
ncbi:hypothetical protein KI387_032890 [Taxus chinensis]|uniref:Disease resistance R13L4/SHOC-2-like LRR domain-containing protein n=1 Tax=Taxus chinensis TaxID=29808 RepID=A0AA38F3Y9_TAXCH|nr:hypothetical protein KI387_032890 [Taxus chinensis]